MQYHVAENGRESGPFTDEEIRGKMASGSIRSSAFVWTEGMSEWLPVGQVIGGSVRPPVPFAIPPPVPAAMPPSAVTGQARKYPKWPWIGFGVAVLLWLMFVGYQASIADEAQPLLNEQTRMQSSEYVAGVGIESFVRGALGDPFGKAGEEYEKDGEIQSRLQRLAVDYQDAAAARSLFGWVAMVFAGLWIWQHVRYSKARLAGWRALG